MDNLEKRLAEDSTYKEEEQEYDGYMSHYLPSAKDLTNYYPGSGNANVEKYEKAILHTNGEVPSQWVLDLTPDEIDELNSYSPEIIHQIGDVANYYEDLFNTENEINETAARRAKSNVNAVNWGAALGAASGVFVAGEKPKDFETEYNKALDEVTQEKLGETLSLFETEDKAMETVINEKVPNNVQEGTLGTLWSKFKNTLSNSYKTGVFLGNSAFRPNSLDPNDVPEKVTNVNNLITTAVLTGKFLSYLATKAVGQEDTNRRNAGAEQRQISEIEAARDMTISNFKAVSATKTWEMAMQTDPGLANEVLNLPFVQGDTMKAQAIFQVMTEANSPELLDANNKFQEAVYDATSEQIKKISSGENTIGEVLVNGLGWYSKHFVGSISTSAFLISTEEGRKMSAEFGLKESIKKMDYSPAEVLGLRGTFTGSMIDLGTSFGFDPTIWLFTPATGIRAGAVKQFAHAKYIKGFMNKGIGQAFADDLYKILRDGTKLQKRKLLRDFSETSGAKLRNTVKDDIARGNSETTSELFYKHYTDALLKGENPYIFHKTAWNKFKAQRTARLVEKAAKGDGKSLKAFRKLLTGKNLSTKVNLAQNPRRAIMEAIESMIQGTKLPEEDIVNVLNSLEDSLDDLYEATLNSGTNFAGSPIAAARLSLINQSDLINYFEMALGRRPRNIIKNLDNSTTASGQSVRNLELDEIGEGVKNLDMPKFNYQGLSPIIKKAEAKLKTLRKNGAAENIIDKQIDYIQRLKLNRKKGIVKPVKGTKQGEVKSYDQFEVQSILSEDNFWRGSANKEFMQQLLDDANELAGLVSGSKESIEASTQFTKFLDDFYVQLDEIVSGTLKGRNFDEVGALIQKTHHQLMNKLDNIMREYDTLLNTSIRGEQQRVMLDALNKMVVKLNWHKYKRFQGGWFELVSVGDKVYDQAKAIAKGAKKKDKLEVLKDHPNAVWVENPIKIKTNKKGVVTRVDIDWATLKIMMNYQDEVGAASAVLRGQSKVFDKPQGTRFMYNESDEAFMAAGRKYDDQFKRDIKNNFDKKMSDEDIEGFIEQVRDLRRTTNQVVEGELPISPLEFTLVNSAVEGNNVTNLFRRLNEQKWYQIMEKFQRTWAFEKVMRPSTAFVAAFDELFFYKSIHGWKGTTKDYLFHRGVRKTLRQIKKAGGVNKAMNNPALADEINQWVSKALERQQKLPIEISQRYKIGFDKNAPIELLSNTDAGFFQYAQQHIDGLLKDYGFQQYAQVIDKLRKLKPGKNLTQKQIDDLLIKGDEDWAKWFSTSDADYIKGLKLYGYKQGESSINTVYMGLNKKPVPHQHYLTNSEEAWKYYSSLKKWYTMGVPKQHVDDVWNSFIKASLDRTRKGGNINALPDVKHIGRIKVPGVKKQNGFLGQRNPLMARESSLMEQMFGNPAWNRANLFANKAHATRRAQLESLFKSQGKQIVRAEDIGEGFGIATEAVDPRFQADAWGMSYFDQQLFDAGYVTDNYIESLAAEYATSEIDDMMLKFHLSTPIGRDFRFLAPFGGPWADFWGRYLKDLTRRSQLRGNWWAFTDEKTAGNFVKQRLADGLNHLPNLRRASYISRVANAELKGSVPNPLAGVGLGEERMQVDFSPVTFLPNGDSPMFAVNPIGGVIPIALIGTAMNILDNDEYFELQDTIEDLFPSTTFFPPKEQWKNDGLGTLGSYIAGGGVLNQTMRSLDFVQEALGMHEAPQSIGDVPTQLKYARTENNYLHDNTNIVLNMQTNWETIGDFQEYVNAIAKDARNNAALSAGSQGIVRLGVPVNVKFTTRYTDVADNWIDFANQVGIFEDVVRPSSRELLKNNPYNEDNKVQVLNDIRKWWFNLGDTTEGRAQQLLLARQYPQIYSMTIPGYTVSELGAVLLSQLEGKIYREGDVFRTGTQDNSSNYSDYLSDGLIETRLPDQKVKHIINENAGWVVNAVPVIYDRMAEIINESETAAAEFFGETQGISSAEILANADMREFFGIELASSDVKNIEDISNKFTNRLFTPEQLGPEVTGLIQEVLAGTDYEYPTINGAYSPIQIIPYLYAAQKAGKINPAYVFSSQDPDSQQFNKGMQLLTGLTKASTFWDEDVDGPEQLQFLKKFENKMYALNELWESNDGQVANNQAIQDLVDDVYETFTIFNHIMGDINSFEGKDIMSGEQWWNFFIKPKFKALDLDWKQPVPDEGPIENQTFNVTLSDGNVNAEFQTITATKPFKAVKINATSQNVPDGDTINSMYSSSDTETIRVIGIMAYEISTDPVTNPEERAIAIRQKAFLQQLVDRYEGRLYYVTDGRFGNDNRKDPYNRALGWLFVENGINGDLADGQGEYIFFSDHFSPADNYYNINSDDPSVFVDYSKPDPNSWDLSNFIDKIEVDE
nr:hypothetical protein [uncultured Mediterranean phage uvMED]